MERGALDKDIKKVAASNDTNYETTPFSNLKRHKVILTTLWLDACNDDDDDYGAGW